jgi:hypothetical protein
VRDVLVGWRLGVLDVETDSRGELGQGEEGAELEPGGMHFDGWTRVVFGRNRLIWE